MKANLLLLFKIQQEFWQFSNFILRIHVSLLSPQRQMVERQNKLTNSIFQIKWISTENTANRKSKCEYRKAPYQVAIEL